GAMRRLHGGAGLRCLAGWARCQALLSRRECRGAAWICGCGNARERDAEGRSHTTPMELEYGIERPAVPPASSGEGVFSLDCSARRTPEATTSPSRCPEPTA